MRYHIACTILIGLFIGVRSPALGTDNMSGHEMHHHDTGGVLKKVSTDGVTVIFYVETMDAHREAMEKTESSQSSHHHNVGGTKGEDEMMKDMESATHHLSVSFQDAKTKKMIERADGSVTVTGPSGTSVKKTLHWMEAMRHFGACLELKDKGKYQIAAAFTIDGKERKASFEYTRE